MEEYLPDDPDAGGIAAPALDEDYSQMYWASGQDLEKLTAHLNDLTTQFRNRIKDSVIANRIRRIYRYYHNLYYGDSGREDMENLCLGQEGEEVGISVPHFRSILQQIVSMVTQYRLAWDTKAINTEPESLQRARLGNAILDYQLAFQGLDSVIRTAVEHAIVFNVGYIYTFWDAMAGPKAESEQSIFQQQPQSVGDVRYSLPYWDDVVLDLHHRSFREAKWCRIRVPMTRWEWIARYPEFREQLLEESGELIGAEYDSVSSEAEDPNQRHDWLDGWHFYHLPSPELPEGRYLVTVGETALEDQGYQDEQLPLDRITAGEFLQTVFGYSPANDLMGVQEMLNGEWSAIMTNHAALAVQSVWGGPAGSEFSEKQLDCGLVVVHADEKPEPLQLVQTAPEVLNMPERLELEQEKLSGMNSVSRGMPEANLKSGTALALVDAKAVQSQSGLDGSKNRACEGIGTKTLRLYARYGGTSPRPLAIVGKFNRVYMDQFIATDLEVVDRVLVQTGNALAKTPSGRKAIAEDLLGKGMIRTPEEYLNVLSTGQIESLLEYDQAELSLIREENSTLIDGGQAVVSGVDNHVLHIREHHSQLGSTKIRLNTPIAENLMAHIMEHTQMLLNPGVQMLQITLGYHVPGPAVGAGGAPPPGGPQQPGTPKSDGSGNPEGRPEAMAQQPRQPNVPPNTPQ